MTKTKSIILLSGGLDSLVSLAMCYKTYNINLALTFDYGQKSLEKEIDASKKLSEFYNLEHKIIKLDWLKAISTSSLNTEDEVPFFNENEIDNIEISQNTANSVWVPNRNALFINIAASIAEALNCTHIIIGANKEEGATFKDNSKSFIDAINNSLLNSTQKNVQVIAPLIDYDKNQIIEKGIKNNAPLELVHSCYKNEKKHCGTCESCIRLKRALKLNNQIELISKLF